jgi:hypothetical protein
MSGRVRLSERTFAWLNRNYISGVVRPRFDRLLRYRLHMGFEGR